MDSFNYHNIHTNGFVNGHVVIAPTSAIYTSQIELTISCLNLVKTNILSKFDTFCIVKMKESWQNCFVEIDRTEIIDDCLNPKWIKKIILNYNFETIQKMRFEIWSNGNKCIGEYDSTLAEILSSHMSRQFRAKLKNEKSNVTESHIVVVAEELSTCKQTIQMEFRATGLGKKHWIIPNNSFLVLSRSNEDRSYSVVIKTEVVHSTQNPKWQPINIKGSTLCNGDCERTIKIECFDWRRNGQHKLIGQCETTLRNLSKGVGEHNQYQLRKNKASKKYAGTLELTKIVVSEDVSFLDYIRGGTQMHFAVAIDFTASNGSPDHPQSLHYMSGVPNSYEIALRSVGEIIQHYNTSQMYPAFGFGAKLPPVWNVSHMFTLNGNHLNPTCSSIDEIMIHYRNALTRVQLFGPTNFSPVITNTIEIAKQFQDGRHYFVLLIITDGIISDMSQTIRSIINASSLPISIIIVGVGNTDFSEMDELDSDGSLLSLDGQFAERDIVQFVPLNRLLGENNSSVKSQADLAKAVLAEIPDQVTGYMKSRGYQPIVNEVKVTDTLTRIAPTA